MTKVNRKFTDQEVGLIGRTMMQGASLDDIQLFVAICERTGLDPFASQIMPTARTSNFKDAKGDWQKKTTWAPLVRIDGLRKIAVDSGEYAGQEGPWWCGENGDWKEVWLKSEPPCAAKVIVHRKGFTHGLPAVALFKAYAQTVKKDGKETLNNIWSNMGDLMIAKCAEALALRKAFPNEMAGLYTADEMAQAGVVMPESTPEAKEPVAEEVFEWTEKDRQDAFTYLDLASTLVDETTFTKLSEKVKASMSAKEDPNVILRRLVAYNDRAAAKKAKAEA